MDIYVGNEMIDEGLEVLQREGLRSYFSLNFSLDNRTLVLYT
jgi:hypothetical protein